MGIHITHTGYDDIEDLRRNMRDMDRREIAALTPHRTVNDALVSILDEGNLSFTARDDDGDLVAIFGIYEPTALGSAASPWLLGTEILFKHTRDLVLLSREAVQAWSRKYDVLHNVVWAQNVKSIRYLKAVGFTFSDLKTAPRTGAEYYEFEMIRSDDNV
jgi:hypothetical protein